MRTGTSSDVAERTRAVGLGRRVGRGRLSLPMSSLVVPGIAGLVAVAFLAWRPGVGRSLLGSPRAVAFTVACGAVVVAIGWLLPRLGLGARATGLAQAVPVVVAAVVTVLPAFRPVTVEEAFPARPPVSAAPEVAAGAPQVTGRSELSGIDHRAQGAILLVRVGDGSHVLRLEGLDVEPGPDYQLHLVPGADRQRPDGGVHLGALRGSRGDQNYVVPSAAPLERPVTVLIWCRAFAVPVASGTLG